MSEGRNKRKIKIEAKTISWQEKKNLADKEEETLQQNIEDLKTWTNMITSKSEEQLKEYIKSRPQELKTVKVPKSNCKKKTKRAGKSKASSSYNGIMASVLKFHKDDAE